MSTNKNHEQSFEQQITELEAIVNDLSSSQDLEESLKKFERGLELAQKATERLNKIENRLVEIKQKFTNQSEPNETYLEE